MKLAVVKEKGGYAITIESVAGVNPAGMRLYRGGTFPIERFKFDTKKEAVIACDKLDAYLKERPEYVKEDRKAKPDKPRTTIFGGGSD